MNEFLLFVFMMCNQVGVGEVKCEILYDQCVTNLTTDRYYSGDAEKTCTKILAETMWNKR